MSIPANNDLLSITKAASLLGVHPDTLRRLDQKGHVVPKRGPQGERLYSAGDIALLKQLINKPVNERSFSIQEAANILKVTPQTVRRWEKGGLIKPARTLGGQRVFTLKDIQTAQNTSKVIKQIPVQPTVPQPKLTPIATPEKLVVEAPAPSFNASDTYATPVEAPAYTPPPQPAKQPSTDNIVTSKPKNKFNPLPYIVIVILLLLMGGIVAVIGNPILFKSSASNNVEATLPPTVEKIKEIPAKIASIFKAVQ